TFPAANCHRPSKMSAPRRVVTEKNWASSCYHYFLRLESGTWVVAQTSKTLAFCFERTGYVYAMMCIIFPLEKYSEFSILQNSFHFHWCYKYGSTMKTDLRYTPSDIFVTFPFPQNLTANIESELEQIGLTYYEKRRRLMHKMQLGLTKTYNQFHNKKLQAINSDLPEKEIGKEYGRETLNLWKHLKRTENTCSFNEAVENIFELRRLHKQMDETVLKAYDWQDIDLAHDFYEVDYLPENDRVRYTISPDAIKEVLKRLLKLNHEIHEQEVKTGLHAKGKTKKKQKANATEQMKLF
ncbi:MAG: hypothetical protein U9R03_03115, partial [Candidatus Aerophobetes bacterium]|nr:hypothetical protein [Candidatus Aerophobetes bacterium]